MNQGNVNFEENSEELTVNEYKIIQLNHLWDKWLIFKPSRSKDWQLELKKHLPPYFESNVSKVNDFSMRENVLYPPCPQEFLEHLLNGIILRNELGLIKSRYYYIKELQQLLVEYLKLFYYRIDAIFDIFQTNTKLSISKEKYPRVVVQCSNCGLKVFITFHCDGCEEEFYCDETCKKIHQEVHKGSCPNVFNKLPKIVDPLRIEVHVNSTNLGEEILVYNEHHMKYSRLMKGKILLSFLYKSFRKDRWFRNNKYLIEEKILDNHIVIRRGMNVELEILNYENKDFVQRINPKMIHLFKEDDYADMLKLSVLQELKLNFYKLGGLLVDVVKEQHPNCIKYILIFNFP